VRKEYEGSQQISSSRTQTTTTTNQPTKQ